MRVISTNYFESCLHEIEKSDREDVFRKLGRLEDSLIPLGKRLSGKANSIFAIRCGRRASLRLLYEVRQDFAYLLTVGPRANNEVYRKLL